MNDHLHDLEDALYDITGYDRTSHPDIPEIRRLGSLAYNAGDAIDATSYGARSVVRHSLIQVALGAARWYQDITGASMRCVLDAVRAEYDRAHTKHDGNTPANPNMSDMHRAAILLEEVGEVARALTPDAKTPVGHAGNLADELIQTATMAAAWLQHLINQEEAEA